MKIPDARLDLNRRDRLGMVEAIWGQHKTFEQLVEIIQTFEKAGEIALVTRVQREKAERLLNLFENASFHSKANCLTVGSPSKQFDECGEVAILSGGTSDLPVAAEAEVALKFHGVKTNLILDVGVAGLHRLMDQLDQISQSKVVIACAGMEGALPTVLSGLISHPIIGLPVSVGYGVSSGGKAALNGMLSSCAPGLSVVNIDNGYGAAMAAMRILKTVEKR